MKRVFIILILVLTLPVWAQLEFSPIQNISQTPGVVSEEPDLVKDGSNLYLTWNKWGDIAFKKSTDGGASWSAEQILYSGFDSGGNYPAIAKENNNVYVFYHRNTEDNSEIFMCRSTSDGNSFESEVQVTNSNYSAQTCQVAVMNGTIYLAYEDRNNQNTYQICLMKSTDNGDSWSEPVQISEPEYHSRWVNLVAANGTIYATWNAQIGGNYDDLDLFFSKSTDNGQSWSEPLNISNNMAYNARLDTAVLGNNIYIAVSAKPTELQSDIFVYRSENDGEDWENLGNLSDNTGSSSRPNLWLSENPNGAITVYLVWSDDTYASERQIYLRYSLNNGSNWSEPELISAETGASGWPHIIGSSEAEIDQLYCVWHYAEAGTFDYEIYGRAGTYTYQQIASIFGTVQNVTGAPIENALITASSFSTYSNAAGEYELFVSPGSYQVNCSADGYETDTQQVEVNEAENVELNFILEEQSEILFPPVNLTAEVVEDNIQLEWQEPQSDGEYLHWDNGENTDSVGGDSVPLFDSAVRFTPGDLSQYDGDYLTKIRFYLVDNDCELYLRVWQGGSQYFAGELVLEQEVEELTANSWNLVQLDYPIQIDSSQELWFGYHIINPNGAYPAGTDAGPAVPFHGDMLLYGSDWVSMSDYFGWNINWNIQGLVVSANSEKFSQTNSKELLGYNIYMDDVLIEENYTGGTSYLVSDLEPEQIYQFYVTAVYTSGESAASNIVEAGLTANSGENVPETCSLQGNYPNPFNPSTTIYFQIGNNANAKLEIFNLRGQKITSYDLNSNQTQLVWNGRDSEGREVESGIYLYRLITPTKQISRKMLLLK
jgi:hypothetical protein